MVVHVNKTKYFVHWFCNCNLFCFLFCLKTGPQNKTNLFLRTQKQQNVFGKAKTKSLSTTTYKNIHQTKSKQKMLVFVVFQNNNFDTSGPIKHLMIIIIELTKTNFIYSLKDYLQLISIGALSYSVMICFFYKKKLIFLIKNSI